MKRSGRSRERDGERQAKRRQRKPRDPAQADAEIEELDDEQLDRMAEFLERHGGVYDYGRFGAEFPGVKKRQLETHFDFVPLDGNAGGRWEIRLLGQVDGDGGGVQREEVRQVRGNIRFFDKTKGYGFILSDEEPGDIFFPRVALPRQWQETRPDELRGMEVMFELSFKDDGKPRAEKIFPMPTDAPGQRGRERSRSRERGAGGVGGSSPSAGRKTVIGRIRNFDRAKGFGFIKGTDTGEDVFFLPSVLPKELANLDTIEGEEVEAEVEPASEEGKKPRAKSIVVLNRRGRPGSAPPRTPRDGSIHMGAIVNYDPGKGFGFIKGDHIGEDVFFAKSEMPPDMAERRREEVVDCRVEFEVKLMSDGKMRALRLVPKPQNAPPPPPPAHRGPAGMMPMPPMPPPPGGDWGMMPPGPVGHIRRFDRAKGYGFIVVPGQHEDIFFLPSCLPKELKDSEKLEGMEVAVDFYVNEEGKPRATRVTPMPPRPPGFMAGPYMPPMPMPMGPPMGPPMGGPMPPMPPMPHMRPPMMGMPPPPQGGRDLKLYTGEIVRFDTGKGFGFIAPDGMSEDVFCLRTALPPELREQPNKDQIIGQRIEFEVKEMPDGKLRATNCILLRPGRPSGGGAGGGPRRSFGRIVKFEAAKGYGFIKSPDNTSNVFFLRSSLPKEFQDIPPEEYLDLEVSFDMGMNEEGKPRASHVLVEDRSRGSSAQDASRPNVQSGEVMTGTIVRYQRDKAFGFLKPDQLEEDVFFLRSEMPEPLKEGADDLPMDQIENQRVEFEVLVMSGGKLRAQRMLLLEGGDRDANQGDAGRPADLLPLEDSLLGEMEDFLEQQGGGCDYGRFTNRFPKVKKKQLEGHFDFIGNLQRGPVRIELPDGHPAKAEVPPPPEVDRGEDDARPAEENEPVDEGAPDDEPAIPLGPGCQPQGVIRVYDPSKGFGFVQCEGFDQDIFFPRSALPENFHGRKKSEMPELNGVHVAIDLNPSTDRGPRAERVSLMLNWHVTDKCWLLKRS